MIRFDTRGHGRSDSPEGIYTLDRLGQDALAIPDAAGAPRAHAAGLSLGGMVALWLATHSPERLGRIVAANTGARVGTVEIWEQRMKDATSQGMRAIAETVTARWFTDRFRQAEPATVDRFRTMLGDCSVTGYTGCCAALRDADLRDDLHRVTTPTLVITGTHDHATPPAVGDVIRTRAVTTQALMLDAAHLSNVEQPGATRRLHLGGTELPPPLRLSDG